MKTTSRTAGGLAGGAVVGTAVASRLPISGSDISGKALKATGSKVKQAGGKLKGTVGKVEAGAKQFKQANRGQADLTGPDLDFDEVTEPVEIDFDVPGKAAEPTIGHKFDEPRSDISAGDPLARRRERQQTRPEADRRGGDSAFEQARQGMQERDFGAERNPGGRLLTEEGDLRNLGSIAGGVAAGGGLAAPTDSQLGMVDTLPDVDAFGDVGLRGDVDVLGDLRTDTRLDTRQDVRTDTRTDTRQDTRLDTRLDTRQDTRQDVRMDVRADPAMRGDANIDLDIESGDDIRAPDVGGGGWEVQFNAKGPTASDLVFGGGGGDGNVDDFLF